MLNLHNYETYSHKPKASDNEKSDYRKTRRARSLASKQRVDLISIAKLLIQNGEILPLEKWIIEVAYCLTSACEGPTRSPKILENKAPFWRGHEDAFFASTMRECGFVTTECQRNEAIDKVWAVRKRINWWGRRNIDRIGRKLGVTSEIRREAGARLVGAIGETAASRKKARLERDKQTKAAKRREDGQMLRSEYEANSLSKTKPWEAMGISRATFYRRKGETTLSCRETTDTSVRQVVRQRIYNNIVGDGLVSFETGTAQRISRTPKVARRNRPLVIGNVLVLHPSLRIQVDVPKLASLRLGTAIEPMRLAI